MEYAFQYLVDGEIRIADPYTDKILDPWNDNNIPSSTYPNLKDYPTNKTNHAVSVFQTDQSEFQWQNDDDFVQPEQKDLVIYELLIRDFIQNHDYQTLIDTLDYLEDLGINAIELMPINEFEGNSSWGYNPSFYFAPDKYYGTKNDLKSFIDECHRRGIAVIQDMVLNHSYRQSPFVRLYWDSINNRPAINNPWYNEKSPNNVYSTLGQDLKLTFREFKIVYNSLSL
jgi:pullulanase/glycogen debranching enzyme